MEAGAVEYVVGRYFKFDTIGWRSTSPHGETTTRRRYRIHFTGISSTAETIIETLVK